MIKEFSYNGHVEKAELVTDFNNLSIGDIIWTVACNWCQNAPHRFFLLKYINNGFIYISKKGKGEDRAYYEILPLIHNEDGFNVVLIPDAIINKEVYRVINSIKDINKEIEEELLNRKLFV